MGVILGSLVTLTLLAPPPERGPEPAADAFQIETRRDDDRIDVVRADGRVTFTITSPMGISRATITRREEKWPGQVVVRLRLRGLESFSAECGGVQLGASVLSHSGHRRLLHVKRQGEEEAVEKGNKYWTEIKACNADGKPIPGLPGRRGYFEIALPGALLEGNPRSLTLGWIDFYR